MNTSDDNHNHPNSSWYPPEANSHQGQTHSKPQYYQPVNGNRPNTHHPYQHHTNNIHPHHAPLYGHHQYSYHYHHGPEEHIDDSNTPSGVPTTNRRDSFPYYPHYQPQQATPIQPPPNVYNGPPVSALVPRFPRGPSNVYSQNGYTPHSIQYDSSHLRALSLSASSFPPSGGQVDSASHSKVSIASKDRRTSIGLPIISNNPNFLVPTPQQTSNEDVNDTNSEASTTMIPAPPTKENDNVSKSDSERISPQQSSYSNQESRCVNLLSQKFEPSMNKTWPSSLPHVENGGSVSKKSPTVQDASLLLGLSYDTSNNSSPATVPTLQDESEAVDRKIKAKPQPENILPKTCFPVPIPKNYPRRLALPNDSMKLNALHCFLRSNLLEIFVVEPSPEALKFRHAPISSVGRVGFRCVHCFMTRTNSMNAARDDDAPMSVFFPKTVCEIYRLVTSWQRCHVRKCKNLPNDVRETWYSLRETEKCRGKTSYWIDSAKEIGLIDCTSRMGGIRFNVQDEKTVVPIKEEYDEENSMTSIDENSEPTKMYNITNGIKRERNVLMVSSSSGGAVNGTVSTPLGSSTNRNMSNFQNY
jgi:hypothetical protein